MNTAVLTVKNLMRNPTRTVLTLAAVALPMALFVLTTSVRDGLDAVFANAKKELRLATHNRVSLINPLRLGMKADILEIDKDGSLIEAVCGVRWFGGKVKDVPGVLPSLAAEVDTFPRVYSDYQMSADEIKEWQAHKNGAVVGKNTAERFGWTAGSEFELTSSVPPFQSLRFRCVKVADKGRDLNVIYFRMDYFNDYLENNTGAQKEQYGYGRVNVFWIKCKDPTRVEWLAEAIDQRFLNTPDETKTEDESAFITSFIKAGGDFPGKLQIVGMTVLLAIITVVANTMSLSFRERTRELAVFKALGFSKGWVVRMVLAESLLLTTVGGIIGILPTYLFFLKGVRIPNVNNIPPLHVPDSTALTGMGVVVVIGFLAGLLPAMESLRLKVVDALRKVG